jgi:hypothetical protein
MIESCELVLSDFDRGIFCDAPESEIAADVWATLAPNPHLFESTNLHGGRDGCGSSPHHPLWD